MCLRGLAAGGDIPLELPGRQHQAAHRRGSPHCTRRCETPRPPTTTSPASTPPSSSTGTPAPVS
jgi:hypothetical protein